MVQGKDKANGKAKWYHVEGTASDKYVKEEAEILKKLNTIKYISTNKKTQVITPTLLGEIIYDVVECSMKQLLNPELTASWEKGLTYVAEGSITSQEYMDKLEGFVGRRTQAVMGLNNQRQLIMMFDESAKNYK